VKARARVPVIIELQTRLSHSGLHAGSRARHILVTLACRHAARQDTYTFTHADTLRGTAYPDSREWWTWCSTTCLTAVNPAEQQRSRYDAIPYRVLRPRERCRSNLMGLAVADSNRSGGRVVASPETETPLLWRRWRRTARGGGGAGWLAGGGGGRSAGWGGGSRGGAGGAGVGGGAGPVGGGGGGVGGGGGRGRARTVNVLSQAPTRGAAIAPWDGGVVWK